MIKIDFVLAITAGMSVANPVVLISWIVYTLRKENDFVLKLKNLEQCPYCTYLFFDDGDTHFKMCPRCESYISTTETEAAQ